MYIRPAGESRISSEDVGTEFELLDGMLSDLLDITPTHSGFSLFERGSHNKGFTNEQKRQIFTLTVI